ncbi:BrnT family toxin [Cupriavidus necator]|uniref:BrnT family toxin n=1 Tax=Cupriavidus necator TaxID=106590 RepID=UPI0027D84317|nr:BrnT family toxin [Cupriavidus necator]
MKIDHRKPCGETRYVAYGPIGPRLYCLVFTLRGDTLRAISLRKANAREVRDDEQEI